MSFEKKEHRPWNSLLENTVRESRLVPADDFDLDIDDGLEFNFLTDEETSSQFTQMAAISTHNEEELTEAQRELRNAIRQTKQQQTGIAQQLHDKSAISLGGFFRAHQLSPQPESQSGREINSLLSDLRKKKEQLSSLTTNLKISELEEKAEQATLSKKAEERGRIAAETRMRQAIEQAQVAAEQFHTAMEQANQAANAHKEEEKLRKAAEQKAKEATALAENAKIELQNERLARISAEEKAQQAIMDAEQAILYKQQLEYTSEQLRGLEKVKQEYEVLQQVYEKNKFEYEQSAGNINTLRKEIEAFTAKYTAAEQKIVELTAQRDKLKTIIESEQNLRKLAEKKLHEALIKAERSERDRQAAEQQMYITEERAKHAIANASQTVMQLLNAPMTQDVSLNKAKTKIRVQPSTSEDDYTF